jgi:[protein-PII] uridylyltransferase
MTQTCILPAAIPEWQSIDSLVVRDFYHRYTVDEHTIVAVQSIDDLLLKKKDTPTRFHGFELNEDDQAVLRLAILLHDIGKGITPGDHVRGSLEGASMILERMRAPQLLRERILFLIEHHLDLSSIMSGRDLEDPATARALTARVDTQEDLLRLTLLTYADISAVNPTAMTPWRLEQLWRVYLMGLDQLTRELNSDRIHEPAQPGWPEDLSAGMTEFLTGLPKRYLRTHTREQIEQHYRLAEKSKREGAAIEVAREAGAYVLTVLAHDHRGLFSSLCGTLASFGMNIVKAEAASNAHGCILDLIRFTDPLRTLELNPSEIHRLEWTVDCVMKGTIAVTDLLKRRRPVRRPTSDAVIAPAVRCDNDASDSATLIDFTGEDRPGLLYDLTSAISALGCNIEVVMIDTEAHKALDVFYVTWRGGKLNSDLQDRLKNALIAACTAS